MRQRARHSARERSLSVGRFLPAFSRTGAVLRLDWRRPRPRGGPRTGRTHVDGAGRMAKDAQIARRSRLFHLGFRGIRPALSVRQRPALAGILRHDSRQSGNMRNGLRSRPRDDEHASRAASGRAGHGRPVVERKTGTEPAADYREAVRDSRRLHARVLSP